MSRLFVTDSNRRWWVLLGTSVGLFLLMLDSTVVNVALPAIQKDFGSSASELQWVVDGYLLAIAALVITAGRLGDIFGRRRIFTIGLVIFAMGSVAAGLAPSDECLIGARFLMGFGAAPMLSLSLAIVSDTFDDSSRPKALGIWTAISGLALAAGPLVAGLLVQHASWRWIFLLNIPFAAIGVSVTLAAAEESRDETAPRRLDVAGLVTLTVALTALVLGLIEGREWGAQAMIALLAFGAAAFWLLWRVEHRVAAPIIEFRLFRNAPYLGATAAGFSLSLSYWFLMFLQPQYLQNVLGYSPLATGVLILPLTVFMLVVSPLTGRLIARFGARELMTAGMLCVTAGVYLMTRITPESGYGVLFPGFLLFGLGTGLVYAPMSTAAMTAMPEEKAGIAAGVLAMNRVGAGALGLATLGALFEHLRSDGMASLPASAGRSAQIQAGHAAFATALSGTMWGAFAIGLVGAALVWRLRAPRQHAVAGGSAQAGAKSLSAAPPS